MATTNATLVTADVTVVARPLLLLLVLLLLLPLVTVELLQQRARADIHLLLLLVLTAATMATTEIRHPDGVAFLRQLP